ncbi:MAG TPA: aspartyl protease family protein, partial [Gemmataceae bacterium]|nr:aspartyl protease family protein [Gemmataceae bacterium]
MALVGPTNTAALEAVLDTAADDTVFPEDTAAAIGLDLSSAPTGTAAGVGGGSGVLRYAEVTLR